MTRVKICGLNDPVAVETAAAAGADWLGFVFFPPSPRNVSPAQAADLSAGVPAGPGRVGLFVDPSDEEVARVLGVLHLDALQLYVGAERAKEIRDRFGVPVWRAVGVSSASDLPVAADGADALLIEAKPPEGATRPGGNAARFDWELLSNWRAPGPWLLAGGLDPSNVAQAICVSGAHAVDVSSGVERTKGVKDAALIRAFIAAAKGIG